MTDLTGDFGLLDETIERFRTLAHPDTMTRLSKVLGNESLALIEEGFAEEHQPSGVPWIRSLRAMRDGGQTLTDTGRLRSHFRLHVHPGGFEIENETFYAVYHQGGATFQPRSQSASWDRKGRFTRPYSRQAFRMKTINVGGGTLPRRPMVPDDNQPLPPRWQSVFEEATTDLIDGILTR